MAKLEIKPLSPLFGVEVIGLAPHFPLQPSLCALLQSAFDEHRLVVVRGLDIGEDFQAYLAGLMIGEDRTPAPSAMDAARETEPTLVSNRHNGNAPFGRLLFHTDMMWSENAFRLISLYGLEIEEPTTPTLFVNTVQAWASLPQDLRARAEGRFAIHGRESRTGGDGEVLITSYKAEHTAKLPIGRAHPHTGDIMLYVDQRSTYGIADMDEEESRALLEALHAHLYAPQNVVAHHWRKGDLVLWDNLALQHARPNVSVKGPARVLRKVYAPKPQMARSLKPEYSRAGAM
jgi:taurine dioxygenase